MARNQKVVPECQAAIDQMKYEIAAELGIAVGPQAAEFNAEFAAELGSIPSGSIREDYWGFVSSRDAGAVGGQITRRLIQQAEQNLYQ